MLDRAASRQSGAASCNSSIPQLDGVDDSELVKIGQLDGSTDDEDGSNHDEDSSTVDDATGGDEDPTENVENVQLGEKEKVTIYCALED